MASSRTKKKRDSAPSIEATLREAGIGAFFRPSQVAEHGVGYHRLRRLVSEGEVEQIGRGLYRVVSIEPTEKYSIAAVCARIPNSIVCLLSALTVYDIGTQVPRDVWIAIPHKARAPRFKDVKIRLFRFSGPSWTYGVNDIEFEGVPARITSPARTVVDCFRFEHLIGREAAMEALRDALHQKKVTIDGLYRVLQVLPSRRLKMVLEASL